ncbi:MAG: electron transfer flavoprotein subunit alpha/FixB family protein [Chloroflexota bacterium]|nr:electron transfer flavoprotein subunit alpha/FixB family protein [Chloroflexota bacterium]
MGNSEPGGVLIAAEVGGNGALRPVSFELVTAGRRLADQLGATLSVVVMAPHASAVASELGATGVDRVLAVDDERLAGLPSEPAATALAAAIELTKPAVVLAPGTTAGRDYAPRVAARLGLGSAADCIDLQIEDGTLVAVRTVLGGRLQTRVKLPAGAPRIATIRAGSFARAEANGSASEAETLPVEFGPRDGRVRMGATAEKPSGPTNLEAAKIVVAGGRGVKEPDKFVVVEELAAALGGAVGATRAVVDAGWRPHHEQIGQTGRTVSPRLYVAVGVSGAVQHNVGMQGSDVIVAINRDPDAPIFKIAQFGIVGDLFEVVPAVIAELEGTAG